MGPTRKEFQVSLGGSNDHSSRDQADSPSEKHSLQGSWKSKLGRQHSDDWHENDWGRRWNAGQQPLLIYIPVQPHTPSFSIFLVLGMMLSSGKHAKVKKIKHCLSSWVYTWQCVSPEENPATMWHREYLSLNLHSTPHPVPGRVVGSLWTFIRIMVTNIRLEDCCKDGKWVKCL